MSYSTKSRKCTPCSTAWPPDHQDCPRCGGATWASQERPDYTPAEVHAMLVDSVELPASSPAHANRVERYIDMGFSEVDAELMACSKDAKGFYLYHGDIRRCLEAGATHDQMVAIHA